MTDTTTPLTAAELDALERQVQEWPRYQGWGTHPLFEYDDVRRLVAMARRGVVYPSVQGFREVTIRLTDDEYARLEGRAAETGRVVERQAGFEFRYCNTHNPGAALNPAQEATVPQFGLPPKCNCGAHQEAVPHDPSCATQEVTDGH